MKQVAFGNMNTIYTNDGLVLPQRLDLRDGNEKVSVILNNKYLSFYIDENCFCNNLISSLILCNFQYVYISIRSLISFKYSLLTLPRDPHNVIVSLYRNELITSSRYIINIFE